MPIHDWTSTGEGVFHFFRQRWIQAICDMLNAGELPPGYFAMSVMNSARRRSTYGERADHIEICQTEGQAIATIDIVSPSDKNSPETLSEFCGRVASRLLEGVNASVVDLFPPARNDPNGIHALLWQRFGEDSSPFQMPADSPLTLASYSAGVPITAYIDTLAVGETLSGLPVFVKPDFYINCPLETTYQTTWSVFPKELKSKLES